MKIVLAGGTGQIGQILQRALHRDGHEIVVLSRAAQATVLPHDIRTVTWDARTLGPWVAEIDGADAVINLAGRSVNCRYTAKNLAAIRSSRVESTQIVGEAIVRAARPPLVWLQMSTATIYAHRFDAPNDEATGLIGGTEPDVPRYWDTSIAIARAWEAALEAAPTPQTRKVSLRTAMVMSPDRGGVFDTLATLARRGLSGAAGDGKQFVSWIHECDFAAAIRFLLSRNDLSGPINLAAPGPLTNRDFQAALRRALGLRFGLPSPRWLLELGAFFLRTDTELLLKSRRVIPDCLLSKGFNFQFPEWPAAATDLSTRWKAMRKF